jgi:hypothetical protein
MLLYRSLVWYNQYIPGRGESEPPGRAFLENSRRETEVDNHDRKRAGQIARLLAEAYTMIRAILAGLDEIMLPSRSGSGDMREAIAVDLMMVYSDILPTVEAPGELLTIIRSALLDWVVLNDLVGVTPGVPATSRRLDTMEEVAEKLALTVSLIRDIAPDLLGDVE